jgi:hypothetical protein
MAVTASQLEEIAAWCAGSTDLGAQRNQARRQFFGEGDKRPVEYWPGAEDRISRQWRFLGWFMFDFRTPDDRSPAEVAAQALLRGAELVEVLDAIHRTRFVLAVVASTDGRRSTILELEDERFEVHNSTWSRVMRRGSAVVAHLVPVRNRFWLAAPGWLEWPIAIGPNMRRELRKFQPDPVQIERLMQGRASEPGSAPPQEYAEDATLEAAVARITAAAEETGRTELVMSIEEWRAIVLRHLRDTDPSSYFQEILGRLSSPPYLDNMNRWLALANNIWNACPQPDRGGKSALELSAAWRADLPRRHP